MRGRSLGSKKMARPKSTAKEEERGGGEGFHWVLATCKIHENLGSKSVRVRGSHDAGSITM